MITVLWVITGAAILMLGATVTGRRAFDASRNRVLAERAYWRARECAARGLAAADGNLGSAASETEAATVWRALGAAVAASPEALADACTVALIPAGTAIDVNAAPLELLIRVFDRLGAPNSADIADAVMDWRDRDHDPLPRGAEADWYAAHGRRGPRNGPFASIGELRRVRGVDSLDSVESAFTVEEGPLFWGGATATALSAVPGFTSEVLDRLLKVREAGAPYPTIEALMAELSASARDSIVAHYQEIATLTSPDPTAWILVASGNNAAGEEIARVELRLLREGSGVQVVRRRARW